MFNTNQQQFIKWPLFCFKVNIAPNVCAYEVYLSLAYLMWRLEWNNSSKTFLSFSNKMERETKELFQTFSESHLYTSIPSNIWIL